MNRESKRTVLPDCVHVAVDDPDEAVPQFAIRMEGLLYLPAQLWEFGRVHKPGGSGPELGSIFLALPGGCGLHAAMTPATLRSLAANMIAVAAEIEQHAADQAAGALARAARPGAAS